MKKLVRILSIIIFLGCFTALFAACKDKDYSIQSGTYYSVDNEDSYIVLTDETIKFYNFDFSEIEEAIFNVYGEQVDVAQILTGEQSYVKAPKAPIFYVNVEGYDGLALMFDYVSSENAIMYGEEKYVLREA